MPTWFEGIPTVLGLFAAALAAAAGSLLVARSLGLHRRRLFSLGGSALEPSVIIERLASLADVARREGLLSLEGHVDAAREPLVACGIAMAVEGADAARIRVALDAEIDADTTRPAGWSRFAAGLSHLPAIMVVTGAGLLLVTLVTHAQNPPGTGAAASGAGTLLLLAGAALSGLTQRHGRGSTSHAAATLSALLQSTAVLLICSGADGGAVRKQLRGMLPGQTAEAGRVARAA